MIACQTSAGDQLPRLRDGARALLRATILHLTGMCAMLTHMDLQAVTAQLYVLDGQVQTGSGSVNSTAVPGLLAQSPPSKAARGREHDFLFVHLSLSGRIDETAVLAQDLLDAISQRYYQSSGSVTAALRHALLGANELLLRLNLSGGGPTREGAITCAVLRQEELFILQTGESVALLGHNFGIERLPAHPPERITPFGRTAGLDIRYSHHRLQPGDMLLLLDPRLAPLPTHTFTPVLVDTEVEIGLAQLRDIVGNDTARLLLVEFTDEAPADLPELTPHLPGRKGKRETAVAPPIPQPIREHQAAGVETSTRRATAGAAMGLSRFTGWLAALIGRLSPPQSTTTEPVSYAWSTLIAIVIPVIVALIGMSVYIQRGQVQRMAEIRQGMAQALVQAQDATDTAVQRAQYQTMLTLAVEADTLRPGDSEVRRLRQQAFAALDKLDGVQRLSARILYTYNNNVNLVRITLQDGLNGGLYTLDGTDGAVYRHETDENYLNLQAPTRIASRILDMFWRPRGVSATRDGIAMLNDSGTLLTYYPNLGDTRSVPLGLASEWQTPIAIATYNERLYVLDVGAGKIWKYFPDGDGFLAKDDDRAIAFRQEPELALAVDLDIYSEDASLLVLYGNGRIRYHDTRSSLIQWDETNLMQNGLVTPLVSPVAAKMVGRGLNTSIYVADPGSGRIIKIARSGTVLAQYRATHVNGQELFAHIRDFAVAETPLRIFVVSGNQIYVATLE